MRRVATYCTMWLTRAAAAAQPLPIGLFVGFAAVVILMFYLTVKFSG